MGISFGSINTGLPKDIVKQIMAAERIPLQKIEARKTNLVAKQKLVAELSTLVSKIKAEVLANRNQKSFRELKASYNGEIIEMTLDKTIAEPGSYQFEVDRMARKSSALSAGYSSKGDEYLGVGYIQYTLPSGETKEVYIDPKSSSLDGIVKMINEDKSNGMRAIAVNDGKGGDEPFRLIVSLEDTGDDNKADFPYFYFVDSDADLYLDKERGAEDALVKLDGFDLEIPTNQTGEIIPGANITLKKAVPGEEFTILITEDAAKIAEKFETLINDINEVLKFIINQNNLDKDSDTSKTLGGDITLQTIESRLRSLIFTEIHTDYGPKRIGDFGVSFQKDGLLKLDKDRLQALVDKNFKSVAQFMTGVFKEDELGKSKGFYDHIYDVVEGVLRRPAGILPNRDRGIQAKIRTIDSQIASRERILTQKENTLKDKFARLEGTISRIKSQGAGLAALQSGAPMSDPVAKLG